METVHNPDMFMADVRQILSQGRKRIGLLVGAGGPLSICLDPDGKISETGEPLIPGVEKLTQKVLGGLLGDEAVAAAAISAELGAGANIEMILSRVRLLATAIGTAEVHDLDGSGYEALGKSICAIIGDLVKVELPPEPNPYSELIAWIGGAAREHAVEIFTTNYDLLFESAFERAKRPYFDGFSGGNLPFFDPVSVASDDLPPRWSRLWKLHGSLGWSLEGKLVVRSGGRAASELVYPDHLKYDLTQRQPYAALFERLKHFLLQPDTLLLSVGFSFRDAHISALIDEALSMNANAAVFAFQHGRIEDEDAVCSLAAHRANLSVYASDGAVIGGVPGKWRFGETMKNWEEIRKTFWGVARAGQPEQFLLGDYRYFTKFCALSHSTDMITGTVPVPAASPPTGGSPTAAPVAVA